jgi:tetratricopeptide (TPR) repeat protein
LEDVFELQDLVTTGVVSQLMAHVQMAEVERANRKPTANLDAYDCYWRGLAQLWKQTKFGSEAALAHFLKAIELDENFALAHAYAGVMYAMRKQSRWMVDVEQESAEAIRLARRAIELGQMDEGALIGGGFLLAYFAGELDLGAECVRRGLEMNPNYATGWRQSAWVQIYLGAHETALEHLRQGQRLNPCDPGMMQSKLAAAIAHLLLGQYEEAAHLSENVASEFPTFSPAWRILAASRALAGDAGSAQIAITKCLELNPSPLKASVLASNMPLRRAADFERLKEGYLRAGFPP